MKQVLAVVAAIALIAGAYYLRVEVVAPADDVAGSPGDQAAPNDVAGEVVCDARLGDACPPEAMRMSLPGILAAFSNRASAPDVLIAPSIVMEMIEGSQQSEVTFGDADVLATTPLAVVTFIDPQRAAADDGCGTSPTWACIALAIGSSPTQLQMGFHDPSDDSDGIAAFAALTGGVLDDAGQRFSNTGFASTEFLSWLQTVQRVVQVDRSPAARVVQSNGAQTNSAVVIEAEAVPVVGSAQANGRLSLRYPTPLASLTVVAVGADGARVGSAAEGVADALQADGWRGPDGAPLTADAPLIADDAGLPPGGILFALRSRW